MPRLLIFATPAALLTRVYTTDFAVGVGGRNMRKDVLLVQFFLAAAQTRPEISEGITRDYSRDGSGRDIRLTIDGVCGQKTTTAIRRFQELYDTGIDPHTPVAMIHDVRVDPATRTMMGPRQGHVLAIGRLNMLYRAQFGENAHSRLFADPLFPPELYDDFFVR
ncbi:MAG: hypothetical protein BGN99_20430 [Alphaproteobacteria bacterium 65-37]|jgi:hypothetical protein|nr:hypothetical protein [Alphaproteobacteria bacterium]OJU41364.1 MAG: hypothetical protein BGN99_20430 [Alphaproteobacteria bacterium 65-37]